MLTRKEARETLKVAIGITDEDLDKISPGYAKLLSIVPEAAAHKITAEVIYSKYCFAQLKVGDKLVFDMGLILDKEESTAPACIGALGNLMESIHVMWDRFAQGVDPNDSIFRTRCCPDPGLERGGLGTVCFKLTMEKKG